VNMRGVMMDVSDRRRAEDELREQATHDSLTGLANRWLLVDRLEAALADPRGRRRGVALLLLDLDDFKEVNDTLGHEAGDSLLVALGDRLRDELADCDTVARLGGDEFAVLLTADADEGVAVAAATRVQAILERPFEVGGLQLHCGASIGIALHPGHGDDVATLIARADIAMYLAKRSGRPWAVYEPALDETSVRRLTLLGQLRRAIADDELDLEFQPCFDLATGRAVAVEALVRWTHRDQGRVEPTDFIRLAEVSGLIQPLSRWVVEHAVDSQQAAGTDLQLSVNLSARNLVESDLVGWLAELLAAKGFPPGRLVLELTESEVMGDVGAALEALRHLRGLGVGVAIDDFGTGRSALAYLKSLPIDELKIDRAFVAGIGTNSRDAAICGSIIDLAHRLGLRVVAEGAASDADLDTLRRLGCDRAQGHFLGFPVAAEGLAGLASRFVGDTGDDVAGGLARS
jgi:diguanylate cyclase (GGDEF)-like protein